MYQLVRVCIHDGFIVLPHWETVRLLLWEIRRFGPQGFKPFYNQTNDLEIEVFHVLARRSARTGRFGASHDRVQAGPVFSL